MVICGTGCQLYIRRQGAPYQDVRISGQFISLFLQSKYFFYQNTQIPGLTQFLL